MSELDSEKGIERDLIESKEHYTYLVQNLLEAYHEGKLPEIKNITVEPEYGYFALIQYYNGENRVMYGHDPGLNPASSVELVKDKAYTKYVLGKNNIQCAEGENYLLPWWADTLRSSDRQQYNELIRDTSDARAYIENNIGYPCYIKPSRGSQGVGVTKVDSSDELAVVFESFDQERVKVAVVEKALNMPDYRLLIFDGELVNAYRRQPLHVVGDGKHTVEELMDYKHEELLETGRDIHMERQRPLIERKLGQLGVLLSDVTEPGEITTLLDISNLSAGGTPIDVMHSIHPKWSDLAKEISSLFNLRVCGVDLACKDITDPNSEYAVIEVNASPGAKQFMATGEGEQARLKELFIRFFQSPDQA